MSKNKTKNEYNDMKFRKFYDIQESEIATVMINFQIFRISLLELRNLPC